MRVVSGLAYLSASMFAALAAGGASAADMPRDYPNVTLPPPALERPAERPQYMTSGWYLRGDMAYRFQHIGESTTGDPTQVPAPTSAKQENAFVFGLGAGIKQEWLRLDVTADYGWRSKYQAEYTGGTFSGKIESFTVLANAYADLGTWYGITPYVGAGIGGADLIFSSYENPAATAPMPSTAVPVSRWNLAWAVMAGLSYTVAPNILIDVGYRHIDMGDVNGGPNEQLTVKKLTGDEIRIGFRYLLD
jgi:opacity protein-like surface antigen